MKAPAGSYQQGILLRDQPDRASGALVPLTTGTSHVKCKSNSLSIRRRMQYENPCQMSEADYLLFQKYKENAGKLRLELGSDLLQLRQEHDRLCLALLQGIEPDDSGCTIVNDSLVSRAVEMAMRWRQQQ